MGLGGGAGSNWGSGAGAGAEATTVPLLLLPLPHEAAGLPPEAERAAAFVSATAGVLLNETYGLYGRLTEGGKLRVGGDGLMYFGGNF